MESWQASREQVYAGIPADGDPPRLSDAYLERAAVVVDERIQRAGVRLAAALNVAFQ